MKDYLEIGFWINCQSRDEIRNKINQSDISKDDIYDLQLLALYIRDRNLDYGRKDISRWMLLEFELKYPRFLKELIPILKDFGYWKDYNLILEEINQNILYQDIESDIYLFLLKQFKEDIEYLNEGNHHQISNLSKYIGKERKHLDKKTKFVDRFTKLLYPEIKNFKRKKNYRIICQKINKVLKKKNKKDIIKMVSTKNDKCHYKLGYIKKNLHLFNRYNICSRYNSRFHKSIIRSENDIYNTKKSGNYIYDNILLNNDITQNYEDTLIKPYNKDDKWHDLESEDEKNKSISCLDYPEKENISVYCFKNNKTSLFDLVKKYENYDNLRKIRDLKNYQSYRSDLNFYRYDSDDYLESSSFSIDESMSSLLSDDEKYCDYDHSLELSQYEFDEDIDRYFDEQLGETNNEYLDWWDEIDVEKGNNYIPDSIYTPYMYNYSFPIKTNINIGSNSIYNNNKDREFNFKPILLKTDKETDKETIETNKETIETNIETDKETIETNKETIETNIETDKETIETNKETDKETIETNKETDKETDKETIETIETDKETDKETIETDKETIETDKETDIETDKETIETDKETIETDKEIIETNLNSNRKPYTWSFGLNLFGFQSDSIPDKEKQSIQEDEEFEIVDFKNYQEVL